MKNAADMVRSGRVKISISGTVRLDGRVVSGQAGSVLKSAYYQIVPLI